MFVCVTFVSSLPVRRRSLDKMHSQLVGSRGKLLVELVESLSGKPVPGKVGKLSPNKKDAAVQLNGMYDSILGAFCLFLFLLVESTRTYIFLQVCLYCPGLPTHLSLCGFSSSIASCATKTLIAPTPCARTHSLPQITWSSVERGQAGDAVGPRRLHKVRGRRTRLLDTVMVIPLL